MVDHVVGGVGGGVLLDSDLGDVVDLVVDLVANRGHGNSRGSLDLNSLDSSWSSNMVGSSRGNSNGGSWGNVMIGNRSNGRCSLHLNSLDLSNSRSSNCVVSNNRGSVGNRINKSILVNIFRESLQ